MRSIIISLSWYKSGRLSLTILLLCLLYFAWPSTAAARTVRRPLHYTIQSGETLAQIALRYNLTIAQLVTLNNLENPNLLYEGQKLRLLDIGTAVDQAAEPELTTYTVAYGDTIGAIAQGYGLTLDELLAYNPLTNPNRIYVGDELLVPLSDTAVAPEPPPASDRIPAGPKLVIVDISEQRTYVYEGDRLLHTFVVSTGLPGQDTAVGHFQVQNKLPVGYGYTWNITMPYWIGIYWSGSLQNGFHALPIDANGYQMWGELLGAPASYGCIILSNEDAATLYEWIEVGTDVQIRY